MRQFQLLLCYTAMERIEIVARQRTVAKAPLKPYAKKLIDSALRPLAEIFTDFMKDIGVEKVGRNNLTSKVDVVHPEELSSTFDIKDKSLLSFCDEKESMGSALQGEIVQSTIGAPEDTYTSVQNKGAHAMHLRLEHLFDKVGHYFSTEDEAVEFDVPQEKIIDYSSTNKVTSKPVVIGDTLPVPTDCPESVEQLLEAALAHHNLGSYDESLKFLEASRVQLLEEELRKQKDVSTSEAKISCIKSIDASSVKLPLDMYVYITTCKGNVYQSCGDDENSMLMYLDCLSRAVAEGNVEWEMVTITNLGMLAYYNMKYELARKCFAKVVIFRVAEYGEMSADTATAWNNEACCLCCLNSRSEARALFERSWSVLCKTLGHRHPRSIATWKNLEKVKRFQRSMSRKDFGDTLMVRDDADRILVGGEFTINAIPPPGDGPKKKKGGGKKKGKKKK